MVWTHENYSEVGYSLNKIKEMKLIDMLCNGTILFHEVWTTVIAPLNSANT